MQPGQLIRREVGPEEQAVEIGNLHQRTPDCSQLSGLGITGQHGSRHRGDDPALRQAVFQLGDLQIDGRSVFIDRRTVLPESGQQGLQFAFEDLQPGFGIVALLECGGAVMQGGFPPGGIRSVAGRSVRAGAAACLATSGRVEP